MTIKRFFLITLLELGCTIALRFFYFQGNLGSGDFAYYFYLVLVAFVTLVSIRRFGVISYFEAIFLFLFWLGFGLFLDLIITSAFLGTGIFKDWQFWAGYFVMVIVVFLLHKKRHLQVRRELHAKHHGHH